MSDENLPKLYRTLVGLKSSITDSLSRRKYCHYNIGQTLTLIRNQYIELLPSGEREFVEKTIPPVDYKVPRKGDSGIWTLDSGEAWRLYSQLAPLLTSGRSSSNRGKPNPFDPYIREVFLVHGHDDAARESVARFLEQLDFTAIILHEQANSGKTIVEKLEAHSKVAFAVVLLTSDDEGRKKGTNTLVGRARQNVILELGYFIGLLGRPNVCALHRGDIEKPSDYLGVLFIPMDSTGAWKLQLAKEMKAAGLELDMNLVL